MTLSRSSLCLFGVLLLFVSIPQFCDAKGLSAKTLERPDDRGRLISTLLEKYDKRNYPTGNEVKLGLTVLRFNADETKKVFEVDGWIKMIWSDPRLEWDPSDFGGEKGVSLPEDQLWRPDISLYNTANQLELLHCSKTNYVVNNKGVVIWVPSCHLVANCDVKPFDQGAQNCTLKFGPWTLDGNTVDIVLEEPKADTTSFLDIGDFSLTGNFAYRNSTTYPCCSEPYVSVTYDFTFEKKN